MNKKQQVQKYIAGFTSDKREQKNLLKVWNASGKPSISTKKFVRASYDPDKNEMILPIGMPSMDMESAFFEELAHARQQQSLQDPKRPYTKKEQEYYDFDSIEYLKKEDPDAYQGLNTILGGFGSIFSGITTHPLISLKTPVTGLKSAVGVAGVHQIMKLMDKLSAKQVIKHNRKDYKVYGETMDYNATDYEMLDAETERGFTAEQKFKEFLHNHNSDDGVVDYNTLYQTPYTYESMAHTQLDPKAGREIDDYYGEKDTRAISDMLRDEFGKLQEGSPSFIGNIFRNYRFLVENKKNDIKINNAINEKINRDVEILEQRKELMDKGEYSDDTVMDIKSFVQDALIYPREQINK
tara:strand:+ start:520 stop:1578 length:1059 start_codon:yes stop_codon:yes gene_type:complete